MSEKRALDIALEPSPKVQVVADPGIATSKTPVYHIVSVKCGKCERLTTVFLQLSTLPKPIQKLFDSIHYDSESCPQTEEALALAREHPPEEQCFKLQLKALLEPIIWEKEPNTCNDPAWLQTLDFAPGKRRGGKMGFLQDKDVMHPSAEALGEVLLKSLEVMSPRVRLLPAGAILSLGTFFVPEPWILEANEKDTATWLLFHPNTQLHV
jgi:hypothetical protein